mgnify:FL=1
MSFRDYLEKPAFELQVYHKHADVPQDAVAFIGSARQHPYDKEKILLIVDEGADETLLLEFRIEDVLSAENLPNPVTQRGESYTKVKLWIRRGAVGVRYEPFEVDNPLKYIHSIGS